MRRITVPPHRLTPLRNHWTKIYPPLVEHLKLQVRMNTRTKQVEMRTSKHTVDAGSALQKGADFLKAFTLGFDVDVAAPKYYGKLTITGRYLLATSRRPLPRNLHNPRRQTLPPR